MDNLPHAFRRHHLHPRREPGTAAGAHPDRRRAGRRRAGRGLARLVVVAALRIIPSKGAFGSRRWSSRRA